VLWRFFTNERTTRHFSALAGRITNRLGSPDEDRLDNTGAGEMGVQSVPFPSQKGDSGLHIQFSAKAQGSMAGLFEVKGGCG
jgi:hypothetical protein